ncbi:hypothetical protein KJ632_01730 [Patescibacteria group bacterium]|nr:hypothetical protein [Patescibacteria group bacterium]
MFDPEDTEIWTPDFYIPKLQVVLPAPDLLPKPEDSEAFKLMQELVHTIEELGIDLGERYIPTKDRMVDYKDYFSGIPRFGHENDSVDCRDYSGNVLQMKSSGKFGERAKQHDSVGHVISDIWMKLLEVGRVNNEDASKFFPLYLRPCFKNGDRRCVRPDNGHITFGIASMTNLSCAVGWGGSECRQWVGSGFTSRIWRIDLQSYFRTG